jgi:hypothetical protein
MQTSIKGMALYHEGEWFKTEDKKKEHPQPLRQLYVMERTLTGAALHKVSVPAVCAAEAEKLCGEPVEISADLQQTNYDGKQGLKLTYLSGVALEQIPF